MNLTNSFVGVYLSESYVGKILVSLVLTVINILSIYEKVKGFKENDFNVLLINYMSIPPRLVVGNRIVSVSFLSVAVCSMSTTLF